MKYIILVGLCAWLGYEVYVLIKTIVQKRKAKKLLAQDNKEDN